MLHAACCMLQAHGACSKRTEHARRTKHARCAQRCELTRAQAHDREMSLPIPTSSCACAMRVRTRKCTQLSRTAPARVAMDTCTWRTSHAYAYTYTFTYTYSFTYIGEYVSARRSQASRAACCMRTEHVRDMHLTRKRERDAPALHVRAEHNNTHTNSQIPLRVCACAPERDAAPTKRCANVYPRAHANAAHAQNARTADALRTKRTMNTQ
jgi:hypothetical protein